MARWKQHARVGRLLVQSLEQALGVEFACKGAADIVASRALGLLIASAGKITDLVGKAYRF